MIEAGTILQNRYRVEKQIGQGGMGNVYVAADERFKSVVAIKETIFEDANLRKAFEREARLLNSLKHSALPRVSDHFEENSGQFLVMEYIAGDDLAAMMEKNAAAFPLETVLNWARQLCDALEYLHEQNIIHRDIKPQNLKLTPKGEIVLLDFGLAKGSGGDAANQTAAKSIFGFSRNYASLEQIQGAGTEPRSDLYSLAATLYHLLTGIPPADALTRAMNVLNKQSDPLIPAHLINREVPPSVAELLQNAMALNVEVRPVSAAEMRRLLDESDKTVDISAANSIGGGLLTAEFLTQDTKIIGAKTNVSADSEARTKVTAHDSDARDDYRTITGDDDSDAPTTVLRPFAATQSPKRFKAIGATVGVLLFGVLIAAGYFLNFKASSSNDGANDPSAGKINSFAANAPTIPEITNLATFNANNVLAEKNTNGKTVAAAPVSPVETTKNDTKDAKKQTPTAKSNKQNDATDNIVISDKKIEMGDMIIDEDGIRDKKTGKLLVSSDESEDVKNLTPERLRRLQKFRERMENREKNRQKRIVIVKPPPTPPAVPKP